MTTLRRARWVAPLVALPLLAACGSETDGATTERTAAGANIAAAALSGREQAGEPVDLVELVDVLKRAYEKATTATVTVTGTGAVELQGDGVVDLTGRRPEGRISVAGTQGMGELTLVSVDDRTYVSFGDRQYLELPVRELLASFGGPEGLASSLDLGALADLAEDTVTASYLGTDDVDGEALEHYVVDVDVAALAEQAEDQLGDLLGGMGGMGGMLDGADAGQLPDAVSIDLHLGDDLLRRVSADLGDLGTLEVRLDDWGSPVEITAPPRRRVQELPEGLLDGLLGGMLGSVQPS